MSTNLEPEEDGSIETFESFDPIPARRPPYDPERHRDWVRSITTYAFVAIFALTVIASLYVVIWRGTEWSNTKEFIQVMLPAETALIGSVVGFYFGSQSEKSRRS